MPCLVDGGGIGPCQVRPLAPQLAALNRGCVSLEELAALDALTGEQDPICDAAMVDPLTAAVCTLPQIRALVDDLFAVETE